MTIIFRMTSRIHRFKSKRTNQLWLTFATLCISGATLLLSMGHSAINMASMASKPQQFQVPPPSRRNVTNSKVSLKRNKTMFTQPQRSVMPPRNISSTNNSIYFIHVGKTGGTSVDTIMTQLFGTNLAFQDRFAPRKTGFRRKKWLGAYSQTRLYYGHLHYDWSLLSVLEKNPDDNADIISFLRDPVSRSMSQFYYAKTLPWAKKAHPRPSFLNQTFAEYLKDPGTWRQPIQDGEGGVSFFSGCFKEGWVTTDKNETKAKKFLRTNMTANALVAARNLDKTVWFGLLEDIPRSMKLLQLSLGLKKPLRFPKTNKNKKVTYNKHLTDEERKMIEGYIPADLCFYEYAKRLFEARWQYVTGETDAYEHPQLPSFPRSKHTEQP